MSKHRVGDRRIISISLPEDLASRLDRSVGKGKSGRSATITKMIEAALSPQSPNKVATAPKPKAKPTGKFRVESETMGNLEVPTDRYYGCQTAR